MTEVLTHDALDGIILCTWPNQHAEQSKWVTSLREKRHVRLDLAELRDLIAE